MRISASVYSSSSRPVKELLRELDELVVDFLHIDLTDPIEAEQRLSEVASHSQTESDIHIIHENPKLFLPHVLDAKPAMVCSQIEWGTPENHFSFLSACRQQQITTGIAILPHTPAQQLLELADYIDFVMIMTTSPGKSGGTFSVDAFRQIIAIKHLLPEKQIHVDGGVNNEVAYILHLLGVDLLVSGSYLTGSESLRKSILSLHRPEAQQAQKFIINDFMIPLNLLPVLPEKHLQWVDILQTIESYNQGFVLIQREDGSLSGIISNADLRRAFLHNMQTGSPPPPLSAVNKNPFTIRSSDTAATLHHFLQNLPIIILFLPVIDQNGLLCGALYLNNLTKA